MSRWYSKAHYERIHNYPGSAGNPASTSEQKIAVWEELRQNYAGNQDVWELCSKLIAEEKAKIAAARATLDVKP